MIEMYSVAYKHIDYELPSNWIKTIAVNGFTPNLQFFYRDNTGDNIANYNRFFGELTAQYWVSKNRSNSNYIGFCHYRRYFNFINYGDSIAPRLFVKPDNEILSLLDSSFQEEAALRILSQFDVITSRSVFLNQNIKQQFCASHPDYIWSLFIDSIKKNSPSWLNDNLDYFEISNNFHFWLTYIMSKKIFDEYIGLLFDVIMPIFRKVGDIPDVQGLRFQQSRYPAYLAERFLMLYLHSKRLRVFESQMILFEQDC